MRTGLEVLITEQAKKFKGARLGLITNPSGIDKNLRSAIDVINEHPDLNLKVLFGPEHGVRGDAQAGVKVEDAIDEKTGLPMKSLYGKNKHLRPEMVEDLDVIFYDLQDVGVRYYTVIYTLAYALEGVKKAGKKMVVLDRPNPISHLAVDGNIIPEEFSSFVGGYRLPIIHGMTVGELALYFNEEFAINADLEVIKMEGWSRDMWFEETELPWVYPSPNMPAIDTAILYPGTCLFEGTNISEGRGTTKPFELIGAEWIDGRRLAEELNSLNLEGVGFRPVYFTPTFSKFSGQLIEGVQVHILNREKINPLRVGIEMLNVLFKRYPECEWIKFKEEYFIDKLAGGDYLRKIITTGIKTGELYCELKKSWQDSLNDFKEKRNRYLLYP